MAVVLKTVPRFLLMHYRGQLLVVANQDKPVGVEQRAQADGLADLRRFIHDAEIEAPSCENGMLDAHASCSHDQLKRQNKHYIFKRA